MPLHRITFLFLGLFAATHACEHCGGKLKASLTARESEPKASVLYPDAKIVEYTLDVTEALLSPGGKPVRALALNGTVPGPTLRFREGEIARIHVRNRLPKEETSTHWHGLLVPNLEDGVPYLTTPPIKAGQSRTFEFLLKHAGTYWYHSHTGLQEQRGIYGSIVIEPKVGTPARADLPKIDREEVLVLSDWTNENPNEVMRTLLRGSEWYAIRKGTAQSLWGAWKSGHLRDYLDREKSRLPAMDVSDVAYDAFLVNGQPRQTLAARPGETVRLRIINASAATYFYISAATGPLTLIAADGIDVVPIQQQRLLIGMAETYDVLVTVPADTPPAAWEVRATAQDNSGHASLFLGEAGTPPRPAPAPGPLNSYSMDVALGAVLNEMDETGDVTNAEALAAEIDRPLPPYKRLRATQSTALPAEAPVREATLRLTGDMWRYLWSINGRPIDEQSTIPVKKGEVLRLVLVNDTMMHHPMHLHGHFFRLLMPDGAPADVAPLKHTVDVPPMSRRVIEFYANEDRDWLFHCHLLYHMMSGMARVFSYPAGVGMSGKEATGVAMGAPGSLKSTGTTYRPMLGEHSRPHTYAWIDGSVQSHLSEGLATIQRGRDNLNLAWELGWERVPTSIYEIEASYSHYFNSRWTAFAGYRLNNASGVRDGAIAGASYLLPYLFTLTGSIHSAGEARLTLGRGIPLTSRLSLLVNAQYDTAERFDWQGGVSYTISQRLSLIGTFDSDYGLGAGVGFRF
jgi:FtsP/CotA-like multicopper oxidase with cupredoxin domain